jgi:nitrous oxide reductase accessory protein NosL
MKSELELAFYLAKKESKKLTRGFDVILDLDGMHTLKEVNKSIYSKAKETFYALGAANIRSIGAMAKVPIYKKHDLEYFAFESVGFYPN